MNTGPQDAANLGWKLGSVIRRNRVADILDTYEYERHPVGAAVVRMTELLVDMVVIRSPVLRTFRNFVVGTAMQLKPVSKNGRRGAFEHRHRLSAIRGAPTLSGHSAQDVKLKSERGAPSRLYEALRNRETRGATLVRPDGYNAWCDQDGHSRERHASLLGAIEYWCGLRTPSNATSSIFLSLEH